MRGEFCAPRALGVQAIYCVDYEGAADCANSRPSWIALGGLDPDHAGATSSGAFSVLTTLPTNRRVTNHDGFGATPVSFSWAGTSSSAWPDFSVTYCGFCDSSFQMRFLYTTPRSPELGIFQGSLTSFTLTQEGEPMPTPEPISLVLAGTGLAGIFARRRWAGERGPGTRQV